MSVIQVLQPYYRVEECLDEIRECLEIGWSGVGFKTLMLEDEWKKYTGLPHAHFLSSATAGLHLAVRLLKDKYEWKYGDEIITTPFTFVSTNHVIKYENLTPRFADIDDTLCLDPEQVEKCITKRTRCVMYVGLGGNAGKLREIQDLCKSYNLKLILDAAHMSGTKWLDGTHVGGEGDVSVFSFHSVKNLNTADGGMICTRDADLDARARKLSWLGISKDTYSRSTKESYSWKYSVDDLGYKYHGNSIMASLGLVGLKYLDQDNKYRRYLASVYDDCLQDKVKIIHHENCISSRHLYQVVVENRDKVMEELNKRCIFPGVHYITNTDYPMYFYDSDRCRNANYLSRKILSLPLHLNLKDEDIEYVSKSLLEVTNAL